VLGKEESHLMNILVAGHSKQVVGDLFFYQKLVPICKKAVYQIELDALAKELSEKGLLNIEMLLKEAVKRGTWNHIKEKQFNELPKKIEEMAKSISETGEFYVRRERKVIEKLIENSKKTLSEVSEERFHITQFSVETHITQEETKYILYESIYKGLETPYFNDSSEPPYDFYYPDFIKSLNEFQNIATISNTRAIARDPRWFLMFQSGDKTAQGIWNKPVSEISDEQLLLLYWTRIYDNAFQSMESPDEHVLNNDKLFDAWKDEQISKHDKTHKFKKHGADKPFIKKSPYDRREVFVFSSPDQAKEVHKMNDLTTQKKIEAEQRQIQQKGTIKEYDLRVRGKAPGM